jgi:uncharacterized protein
MTTPNSPGIYITETLTPITNNNVPGEAIGVIAANYNRGPNLPTLISSWNQFVQKYGTFAQAGNNNYMHYAVYQFFNNGGSQLYVLAIPNTDAAYGTLTLQDVNTPPDNVMTVKSVSPGAWADNIYIAITSSGTTGRFNFQVYYGGTASSNLVENFIDLSINPVDPRNVAAIVNSPTYGSSYITLTVSLPSNNYVAGVDDPALISATPLAGGSDGVTAPSLSTAIPAALDQLQGHVLNVNVPGVYAASTINVLSSWAAGRGDVMLIVDGPAPNPPATSAQVATNYINLVTGGSPIAQSSYVTLYAPWIQILDPASSIPGATRWVAPGGAVLGVWARTDNTVGPWQTPAGIQYGQINLVNLEALFTSTDLGNLTNNNINAIRFVPNYYPAVMGGRTLLQSYPDRYIAVRRMLIMLEHDFTFLLQPALFQPNNSALWQQVVSVITNYLTGLMQQGSLGGSTPATTFQVICDSSNNTPATAQSGIVNVSVAVALNSPAEFILINITQNQNTGTTTISTTPAVGS